MKTRILVIASICFVLCAPLCGAYCGDGYLEPDEQCDDGNSDSGDGCDDCRVECQTDGDCPPDFPQCGTYSGLCGECDAHCDCPQQGMFCYYGTCIVDPTFPIYCCDKPGCLPGMSCITFEGNQSTCAEDPNYFCENACDCGPAHCCKDNICVKDINDPWIPGGFEVGPPCQRGVDATYCCPRPQCYAGWASYGDEVLDFRCYQSECEPARDYCGSKCFFAGHCRYGQSCIDVESEPRSVPPGRLCNAPGDCRSNALAEAVYGFKAGDLMPACEPGCPTGMKCESGWRPRGDHSIERIIGFCGSCGDGICDPWEYSTTCSDCFCGDSICDTSEIGTCLNDCGECGDGTCDSWETPKNCPQDCDVVCGDHSCDSSEVETCPDDCGCGVSPTLSDFPAACGDLLCQQGGDFPENCLNCSQDCGPATDDDGDCTADCIDNCPGVSNPDQLDYDGDGYGDACDSDDDDDGVIDGEDECPLTKLGAIVDPSNGCSIEQECPCVGPRGVTGSWRNHGEYVSCVARTAEDLFELGLISEQEKDNVIAEAAQSNCGKDN